MFGTISTSVLSSIEEITLTVTKEREFPKILTTPLQRCEIYLKNINCVTFPSRLGNMII